MPVLFFAFFFLKKKNRSKLLFLKDFFQCQNKFRGDFIWVFTGRYLSFVHSLCIFESFLSFITDLCLLLYDFFLFQGWFSRREETFFQCQNKFEGECLIWVTSLYWSISFFCFIFSLLFGFGSFLTYLCLLLYNFFLFQE